MNEFVVVLSELSSAAHLTAFQLVGFVEEQLRKQRRSESDRFRYAVEITIVEGRARPALDLDNYAKPVIDSITQSRLMWRDDSQIDELIVRRQRDGNSDGTLVRATLKRVCGQHGSAPSHFQARCMEARRGEITYSDVGYQLATCLTSEVPYDLEEDEWMESLKLLTAMLDADDRNNTWNWLREHLPRFMELVPVRRKDSFLNGVLKAHEEGLIGE